MKLIQIFSILVTFYLYFKKGDSEINDYDEAINYKKLFKNKRNIDIFDNMFIVNNNEYQYELYLNKYTIKMSKYIESDFF